MRKGMKIACIVALLVMAATAAVAVLVDPTPKPNTAEATDPKLPGRYTRAQHVRQVVALGAAAVALTFLVAGVERRREVPDLGGQSARPAAGPG